MREISQHFKVEGRPVILLVVSRNSMVITAVTSNYGISAYRFRALTCTEPSRLPRRLFGRLLQYREFRDPSMQDREREERLGFLLSIIDNPFSWEKPFLIDDRNASKMTN